MRESGEELAKRTARVVFGADQCSSTAGASLWSASLVCAARRGCRLGRRVRLTRAAGLGESAGAARDARAPRRAAPAEFRGKKGQERQRGRRRRRRWWHATKRGHAPPHSLLLALDRLPARPARAPLVLVVVVVGLGSAMACHVDLVLIE
ncbi:unnamed protein product [Prorocentrum cordatum]|uniref:Uncharacterized protein n=1 Tax=Prorocentrum cordatum TaxID=2364126 RepID=A0ABN9V027_9DINO|nr:unnamed protein product [Polarella glacialis]